MIESAEEFFRLRTSSSVDEYRRAAHDSAPDHVWLDVIEKYPSMRAWVAHNKTVSIGMLIILASDHDADVRRSVADKLNLTAELFEQLSIDRDPRVRQRIAYNKKVPTSILKQLCRDTEPMVSSAAIDRLQA